MAMNKNNIVEDIKNVLVNDEKLAHQFMRIINYKKTLADETLRNMFLVCLISSDSLVDEKSCEQSIEVFTFLKNHIDLIVDNEKTKKEVMKYIKKGLSIAKRDLKQFKEYNGRD